MTLHQQLEEYRMLIVKQKKLLEDLTGACTRLTQGTYIYKLYKIEQELLEQIEKEKAS